MKRYFSFLFLLLFFLPSSFAQNALLEQLKEEDKINFSFYFYPSTLRMINFQQDTAFNRMIRNIKKLSFYKLDAEYSDSTNLLKLATNFMEQEKYEPYLEVEDTEYQVQIMGIESGKEWMSVATIEGETYMTYVEGSINWLEIPKVYEKIRQDTSTQTGFNILFDYFQESQQRDKSRRERHKKREEERARKEEENKKKAKERQSNGETIKVGALEVYY